MARRGRPPITVTIADGVRAELDPAHLEEMIDTNVKGTIYALRACLPHLLESDRADFVTVASEAGRRGLPFEAVYCASKFAQVGFTRAMDHELRPQGVRCTNICPGGVATEFAMGRGRTADMPELEGMMSAENVAEAVMFAITRPRNHRILEMAFRTRVSLGIGLRTRSVVRRSRGCGYVQVCRHRYREGRGTVDLIGARECSKIGIRTARAPAVYRGAVEDPESMTCPICGKGTLRTVDFGDQQPESRQVQSFTCGHEVEGDRLQTADSDRLDVERRESEETVTPIDTEG